MKARRIEWMTGISCQLLADEVDGRPSCETTILSLLLQVTIISDIKYWWNESAKIQNYHTNKSQLWVAITCVKCTYQNCSARYASHALFDLIWMERLERFFEWMLHKLYYIISSLHNMFPQPTTLLPIRCDTKKQYTYSLFRYLF